jgi:hypothetical protein
LLALQWYQPEKIFWSFLESFLILGVSSLLLRIPVFKNANIEGARKILFFFNVGFFYHLALAHVIVAWFPDHKVTDYFGFGYLLTTLMAIRMYDKKIVARVTLATLETSLIALLVATIVGFGLKQAPNLFNLRALSGSGLETGAVKPVTENLQDIIRKEKTTLTRTLIPDSYKSPLPHETDIFAQSLDYIRTYLTTGEAGDLANGVKLLKMINFETELLSDGFLLIREMDPRHGWGTFVINLSAKNNLLIEIPSPVEEWGISDAGLRIFTELGAQFLALAGSSRTTSPDGASDVLANQATMFGIFHRSMGSRGILQVRGASRDSKAGSNTKTGQSGQGTSALLESTIWIRKEIPEGLSLTNLKQIVGALRVEWGSPPFSNTLRDVVPSGFAELVLDRSSLMMLIASPEQEKASVHQENRNQSIVGYLQDWILEQKEEFPRRGSDQYVKATLDDLIYLDREVLGEFLRYQSDLYDQHGWTTFGIQKLNALSHLAGSVGYEFIRYRDKTSGVDYVILAERKDLSRRRFWGTYVFRMGPSGNYVVQIPRPISELNVFEFGVNLFDQLKATALLIGGSHPLANVDGSSDIIRIENKVNLFNLVNQVINRESLNQSMLLVQCRAFGNRPDRAPTDLDKIISLKQGTMTPSGFDPLMVHLVYILKKDQSTVGFAD